MPKFTAGILLHSRTQVKVLSQVLLNFDVASEDKNSVDDLMVSLSAKDHPELIFISKEMAIEAKLTPTEFISKLRGVFQGPILLISTDEDVQNIEYYVNSGVTDVFSLRDLEQLENFIANFVSYQGSVANVSGAKVLLVEDSKSVRVMIETLFSQHDIEVFYVPTGREALTVLHFEQIDLVITDYMLEGDMTGLSLIRNIRRTTQWYSLPVLAISGYQDDERSKELLRNGVSDIMYKPFDPEFLLMKSQNLIQNKRTFQQLLDKQSLINELEQKDPLTNLYNRNYVTLFCERFLSQSKGTDEQLFLIHFDCDNFKQVNNEIGHDAADNLLVEIADMMMNQTPKGAVLSRLGGDEFIMAIANTNYDNALQVADMVRESISHCDFHGTKVTISVGVSGGGYQTPLDKIYQDTNDALAIAKKDGKNQVILGDLAAELMQLDLSS